MYTTIGNYYSFQMTVFVVLVEFHPIRTTKNQLNRIISTNYSNPNRTTDSHLKRVLNTNCCIHTVVRPDDGSKYARNM